MLAGLKTLAKKSGDHRQFSKKSSFWPNKLKIAAASLLLIFSQLSCAAPTKTKNSEEKCDIYKLTYKGPTELQPLFDSISQTNDIFVSIIANRYPKRCGAVVVIERQYGYIKISVVLSNNIDKVAHNVLSQEEIPNNGKFPETIIAQLVGNLFDNALYNVKKISKRACGRLRPDHGEFDASNISIMEYSSTQNGQSNAACDFLCSGLLESGIIQEILFTSNNIDWLLSRLAFGEKKGVELREQRESIVFDKSIVDPGRYVAFKKVNGSLSVKLDTTHRDAPPLNVRSYSIRVSHFLLNYWTIAIRVAPNRIYRRENFVLTRYQSENSSIDLVDCRRRK